eukprot:1152875-Ditylum_brightwellii.AAC.1
MDTVKQDTKKEYLNCVRSILKADLTGNSMMTAICAYMVPVMRYMFGILLWTQSKLQQLDKKTRKLLTMHGCLHPKSRIHWLYLHCSMGGCGLMSIAETHSHECTALAKYVQASKDPLTFIFHKNNLSAQKFLMKYLGGPKSAKVKETNNQNLAELHCKHLHGLFFWEQAEVAQVDLERLHHWIRNVQLRGKTEAALYTAQEQVLATNNVCHKIYK